MKDQTGQYQNNMPNLPNIGSRKFENIFKIHMKDDQYYYNILKTVNIPENLDQSVYYLTRPGSFMPLTALSYKHYETIDLWWLICIVNNIDNPLHFISPTKVIKIIKPSYVDNIINSIKSSLSS